MFFVFIFVALSTCSCAANTVVLHYNATEFKAGSDTAVFGGVFDHTHVLVALRRSFDCPWLHSEVGASFIQHR